MTNKSELNKCTQMIELPFVTLDVFTDTPFSGNQLAVVQVPKVHRDEVTQEKKQAIAQEFNLSESVILQESQDDNQSWDVGIFMVDKELPFAGHPTIGTSWFLSQKQGHSSGQLNTKAGPIPFNTTPASSVLANVPFAYHHHSQSLSVSTISDCGFDVATENSYPIVSIVNGLGFALIELPSLEALSRINPTGYEVPVELMDSEWRSRAGFYFYVRMDDNSIRTRMCLGNIEDPCTGSAASALSGYLTLKEGVSNKRYKITQGVEMNRPGVIETEVSLNDTNDSVKSIQLGGKCVAMMHGYIKV